MGAEDRLRGTLASLGEGVLTTDSNGRIDYVNGAAETLVGQPASALIGQPVHTIIHLGAPMSEQDGTGLVARVGDHEEPKSLPDDAVILRPDGVRVPVAGTVSAIRGDRTAAGLVLGMHPHPRHKPLKDEFGRAGAESAERLRRAINEDRLVLYQQPTVPLQSSGGPAGYHEVLVRMLDEDGELMLPGAFFPTAERYGLMPDIDRWVVSRVIRWLADNGDRFTSSRLAISVNLAGDSLTDERFLDFIIEELEATGASPNQLLFEITETSAIENLAGARRLMNRLKKLGCRFSLDDFGSGMSSFFYLKNLPVDFLKIDGAFVRDIMTDPLDDAIVESANRIGHVLGKQTIAEFVASQDILDRVRELGVDFAQGHALAEPRPLEGLLEEPGQAASV
ncbi:MAG: hypothetical protein DRQ37_03415 [Gammaproteobacteria bacterium]|nr:MAG: hypothetical protein DRQ37_03415 [Gammaproteobacteria bacterium]